DVVATAIGPDNSQIMEVDTPNGPEGSRQIVLVAEVSGSYRLNVRPLKNTAARGTYKVSVQGIRPSTEKDRDLQEGNNLNKEVLRLYAAGKYDAALPVAEAALAKLEKALGAEDPNVASVLNNMAEIYQSKRN